MKPSSHTYFQGAFSLRQKCDIFDRTKSLSYLLWLVGLGVLIGMTIMDFLPLLTEYQYNNSATQVEVIALDDEFTPPQIALLIPAHKFENRMSEDLWKIAVDVQNMYFGNASELSGASERLRAVNWNVWNDQNLFDNVQNDTNQIYNALSLAFVQKLYTSIKRDEEDVLDGKFSFWNEPIISSGLNLVMWQNSYDYLTAPTTDDSFELRSAMYQILDGYNDSKKMDILFSRILRSICQKMDYSDYDATQEIDSAIKTNRSCQDLLLHSSAPILLDDNGLWIPIPDLHTPIYKIYNWTFFPNASSNSSLWIATDPKNQRKFWIYPDTSVLYFNAPGGKYPSSIHEVPSSDGKYGHKVTIRYSVQMRAKDSRRNCQRDNSAEECFNKCLNSWIINLCKCVPFSTRVGLDYDHNLPYCHPLASTKCNTDDEEKATQMSAQCKQKCKAACEYTLYTWRISHEFFKTDKPNMAQFTLRMFPIFNTFAQFNWIPKSTPEQFMSQLGGLFGGYLGLSAVTVLAVIIRCIQSLKDMIGQRKKGDGKDGMDSTQLSKIYSLEDMEKFRALIEDVVGSQLRDLKRDVESLNAALSRIQSCRVK